MNIHQKLNAVFGEDRTIPDNEARLAAAAPELLQALKNIVKDIKAGTSITRGHKFFKDAQTAIAKAEGK